jgi:hypothetical protein
MFPYVIRLLLSVLVAVMASATGVAELRSDPYTDGTPSYALLMVLWPISAGLMALVVRDYRRSRTGAERRRARFYSLMAMASLSFLALLGATSLAILGV